MSRKEPLSVEALLQKQKEEAAVKPKFMSKAERQRLALEKRQQEVEAAKAKEEAERKKREEFERKAREEVRSTANGLNRYGTSTHTQAPTAPRADRQRYQNGASGPSRDSRMNGYTDKDAPGPSRQPYGHSHGSQSSNGQNAGKSSAGKPNALPKNSYASQDGSGDAPVTAEEQELIRRRYLGIKQGSTKKTRRMLQDRKYMFDHDMEEDTTDTINPVFQNIIEAKAFSSAAKASGIAQLGSPKGTSSSAAAATETLERRRGARNAMDEKHWTEKSLEEMRERDWRIFREDFAIAARGGHIPRPLRSWKESKIPKPILEAIEMIGYQDPSPIQRQAIPIGLENRDLIGIAETGSGKTASFVIPMLAYILDLPRLTDENRHLGPYALILAPTRELAQQIEVETRKFAAHLGFTCVSIVGGRDMNEQAFNMRNGAEIVIATPGRLKDCIERHVLVLGQCTYVVMDEADRMLNLGFEAELNIILDALPVSNLKPDTEDAEDPLKLLRREGEDRVDKYRVTMLYSATMPPGVERMAKKYLRRPAHITIGDANQAVGTVEQRVEFIQSDEKKRQRLMQILHAGVDGPTIVFCSTIIDADGLGKYLASAGWNPAVLHSKKTQAQREEALASLRSGEAPVLVATDLAGRGIDVPNVALVVNFQMSNNIESYIHRIGRTGRAGKHGVAITFLDSGDEELYYDLKQEISRSPVSKVSPELARHPAAQTKITKEMKRKRAAEDEG
ncbi:P-loop containing nucleoside triphosphate hydrolase protein [Tilletiaria anomala UBC 951]|uniref:RNA helicase n=1 Tax=Tilletiaria anomala (strain ATCC 24038 / CBS 436.72 / UBC 951) TaxID=1037660 RepID=A0A066VUE0_TILAU|nr:P-loop containing nucleoside triphosphate hydrolase protein [Tilletiaria anomala UBC 951]KDN42190.1 P-loop containing nucleoside triphosphate hydrolase protein [Tilletiaria anomala UBC 951]